MKHCFSTLGCAELGLEDVFSLARRHSISAVELRALDGSIDLPAYFSKRFSSPADFAAAVRKSGISVVAIDTSLKLVGSSDTEWQKTIDDHLPWAEALGGLNLRVFDGGERSDQNEVRIMAKRLNWWNNLRRQQNWRSNLMIETHDTLFTAKAIKALLTAEPSARILWDSHHTWKRGGEDPVKTWNEISASIEHVHVKDSVSRPIGEHPFTYVPPGEGEFPAAPLMPILAKEFTGYVSLEWARQWHRYLPDLDVALQSAKQHNWW